MTSTNKNDVLWHAAKAAIDRKLAATADLGQPNTEEARRRARLHTLLPIFRNVRADRTCRRSRHAQKSARQNRSPRRPRWRRANAAVAQRALDLTRPAAA
jgi:hypothetical protein